MIIIHELGFLFCCYILIDISKAAEESTGTIFVGVAVTLVIILGVFLVAAITLCVRRRQASKLSTNVPAVETDEIQSQPSANPPAGRSQNHEVNLS